MRPPRRYSWLVCMALAACCSASPLGAAPPDSAETLKFRRYFVPGDRPQDWPKGDISYVPIDKEEFERLIATVQSAPQIALAASARVSRAEYEAKLADRESLSGRARLEIEHAASTPVLLPLAPFGLAVDFVAWDDAENPEAVFGLAADGRAAVYVERSGTLLVDWSLRGRRDPAGAASFALAVPRSPFASLVLDLPREMNLTVSAGVAAEHVAAGDATERWRVELGAVSHCSLKLSPAGAVDPQQRRLALLQQSTRYDFSPGGLDVTEKLTLDVHSEPLHQLELEVDAELRLMSARYGDMDVDWTVAAGTLPQGKRRIVIDLPEPLLGARQQLQLKALAPLVENQLWTLPAIRPHGVFWQEGDVELLTPAPLTLDRLALVGCRESRSGTLPAPLAGESIELQAFAPSASVKVLLSRRRQPLRLNSATQMLLKPDRIEARWQGEFTVDEGERLALGAEIRPGWTIDSVKSLPEDALYDLAPLEIDGRNLNLRLASPLSPQRPIALQIAAHRAATPGDKPLRADEFEVVKFRGASPGARLLSLSAQPPYLLRFDGAEDQARREAETLAPAERRLFADAPLGAVFDLAEGEGGWSVSLEERPRRYRVESLKVAATLTPGPLVESYELRIVPEAAPIDRCLVHFTQPRDEPLRWRETSGKKPFAAARLTKEQQAKLGLTSGETWEIAWASPQSEPLELQATRPSKLDGPLALSLAAAPQASSQKGLVEIRAIDAVPAIVRNLRLKPASFRSPPEAEYSTRRGAYAYDPSGELGMSSEPAIVVERPQPIGELRGALVWDLQLDSRYETTGQAWHKASCLIESSGRPSCTLALPSGVELLELRVDGAAVAWTGAQGRATAPLPPGRRFPQLEVQFTTGGPALRVWNACQPPWPELDIPVLARHWSVWTPPGYELLGAEVRDGRKAPLSWPQRLFGVLGRPLGEPRFEPALAEDWLAVAAAAGNSPARAGETPPAAGRGPAASHPSPTPWSAAPRRDAGGADDAGWRHYQVASADGGRLAPRLIDRTSVIAAGWATLALVLALARWLLRGRPAAQVCLVGVFAIAALLVPEVAAPLGSGALTGAIVSLFYELWLSPRPAERRAGRSASPWLKPEASAAYSLLAALGFGAAWAWAGDAPPNEAPRADRVYRVFIESDAEGKPIEDRPYQIPREFRAELRRREMEATGKPHGWLIKSALYQARLGRNEAEVRVGVAEFTVRYNLEVWSPEARVRIPISRRLASLAPDSAALDGQPIELVWEAGDEALVCDAPDRGSYLLEFKLLPIVTAGAEHNSLRLSIPPVPAARLELQTPAGLTGVEITGAVGPLDWSADHESANVHLGPSPSLALRWPQTIGGSQPTLEVEELLWLKVRPGSVVVDALLNYQVSGGQVRQLELAADRRLRLIPPAADSPVALRGVLPGAGDMADSPQTFQFELNQPLANQLSLPLSLLLSETSGIGNLRLPMLKPLGAHSRRRWLAVSVDLGLEVAVQNDELLERVEVADFLAKWQPKNAAPPLLTYRLPAGESDWSLATRPREPHTTVKQTLALSFQHGGAQLQFDAELMTTAGYCFQHRLLVPAALEIDAVSLQADGAERLHRWARDDEGMLNVFLNTRTTGSQRLSLRGRLPTPAAGRFALPKIEIEGSDPLPQGDLIQLYRQPSVLVSLADLAGLKEISEPAGASPPANFGRAVAALSAERRDFSGTLAVSANQPRVECVQVTSLEYEESGWKAEIEHRLNVEQGVLDALRFEIPAGWTEPFLPTPAATIETAADRSAGKTRLIVRPRAAFETGRHRLSLATRLDAAGSPQVTAPDVRPLLPGSQERYVVLPTQVGVEQVAWETTGLIAAELPEGFTPPFVSPEAFEVYRIAGEAPSAVLYRVERSGDTARVRLADIRVRWRPDGRREAAASFDLEPAGQAFCPLSLPPGWKLAQVAVDGLPVTPIAEGESWKLPLSPNRLPQRVEVIALSASGEASQIWSQFELSAPSLGQLPVEQTLWSLTSPAGWESVEAGGGAIPIDALAYEGYRLKSIASLVGGLSADMAATLPAAELADWRRSWARRLALAKASLDRRRKLAQAAPESSELRAAAAFDQEWSELTARAGMTDLVRQMEQTPPAFDQPGDLWDRTGAEAGSTNRFLVPRDGLAPRVRSLHLGEAGFWQRCGAAAAVALAALLLALATRRGALVELVRRWPQPAVAAIGVCWWLWLSPSPLGWLLIAASLIAAFRWPRAAAEPVSAVAPVGAWAERR